jgi:hypothetical protein
VFALFRLSLEGWAGAFGCPLIGRAAATDVLAGLRAPADLLLEYLNVLRVRGDFMPLIILLPSPDVLGCRGGVFSATPRRRGGGAERAASGW